MVFSIRIRLNERREKTHQAACHGVSVEEHTPHIHSEDKDSTAEKKLFRFVFAISDVFSVLLAFVPVITFFLQVSSSVLN